MVIFDIFVRFCFLFVFFVNEYFMHLRHTKTNFLLHHQFKTKFIINVDTL